MTRTETAPRKKAGGTGKKGKVFMEDKTQLLSMMNDIADSKTAAIKAKIDKVRGEEAAGAGTPKSGAGTKAQQGKNGGGKKVQTSGDKKRQEKAKALDDAKRVIMAREKEKRDRKKARKAESSGAAPVAAASKDVKVKKRVGFA